jgi:hypothetical protein
MKLRQTLIPVLILCLYAVSLVLPVPVSGSGGYVGMESGDDDDNNRHHPKAVILPTVSPTPQPTTLPTTVPTTVPAAVPTTEPTTVPTTSPVVTPVPQLTPVVTPVIGASGPLSLTGAIFRSVTLSYITSGVAYGHSGTYTDSNGVTWEGMPLWYFAGMADDSIQHGSGAFNDSLAAAGYPIVVTSRDGASLTLDSKLVARSGAYLIANTKNGIAIPATDAAAPLVLVGSGAGIGNGLQGVTGISLRINGSGTTTLIPSPTPIPTSPVPTVIPANNIAPTVSPTVSPTLSTPSTSFSLSGAVSRTIDMGYFTRGTDYGHTSSFRDSSGVTWEGMPLWFLAGMVDDTNQHGSGAFSDALAAQGYSITVTGRDGTSVTLDSKAVSRSNAYIVASTKNGVAIAATDADAPVRLVGNGAGIGNGVAGITGISLTFGAATTPTPTPTPTVTTTVTTTTSPVNGTSWNISVEGKMDKIVARSWFDGGVTAGHTGTYKDPEGKTWEGIPLWYFTGLSDDNKQHGAGAFNDSAAGAGYTITVTGHDNASVTLDSRNVTRTSLYLVANKVNGAQIPVTDRNAPVALVGPGISSGQVIGGVDRIVLRFGDSPAATPLLVNNVTPGSAVAERAGIVNSPAEKPVAASITSGGFGWIPTFIIRIAFTPFPEILFQIMQPGLTDGITTGTTPAAGSSGSSPVADNTLTLTGAISDTITVQRVQDGIEYGHTAEYTDAEGNTYTGKPLWFFAGWVDDLNSHSAGAFNDDVAKTGYNITVTGNDTETVIASTDVMRSNGYLIATTKNGNRLTADNGGPLMLVGNNIPADYQVNGVSAIALDLPQSG